MLWLAAFVDTACALNLTLAASLLLNFVLADLFLNFIIAAPPIKFSAMRV